MADKPVAMLIGTECNTEWEDAWSKWYSEKHLPDMFYSCNVKRANRFKLRLPKETDGITLTADERSGKVPYAPYLAIYEFDSWKDVLAYYTGAPRKPQVEEWNRDWVSKGARIVWRIFYDPIKTWDKKPGESGKVPAPGKGHTLMVIGTECNTPHEKAWSDWYTNKHLPEMFEYQGVTKATRYKLRTPKESDGIVPTENERTGKAGYAPYIAVYEFKDWEAIKGYHTWDGRKPIVEDWNNNWTPKGARIVWRIFYQHIKTWQK